MSCGFYERAIFTTKSKKAVGMEGNFSPSMPACLSGPSGTKGVHTQRKREYLQTVLPPRRKTLDSLSIHGKTSHFCGKTSF
jgi:hypothetical protein